MPAWLWDLPPQRYKRQRKPVPRHVRLPLALADRLVFRKVRSRFGGRIRVAASGAAPLGKNLAEFYEAIGMPLIEGYGLTEGGVAALNPLDRPKPGSIGKALPGVEVRLSEDGEILIKSPCLFTGYLNDCQTTAEVLREGWLHTGDLGHIDEESYIFITGRKKELIVSSTGKKVYPSRVEAIFKMRAAHQPRALGWRPSTFRDGVTNRKYRRRADSEGHGRMEGAARSGSDPSTAGIWPRFTKL